MGMYIEHTCIWTVHTMFISWYIWYILITDSRSFLLPRWTVEELKKVENIKTVANLTNNKDVFMCILRFHARAGCLQHYETLLKELNAHPALDPVPPDQYEVECVALLTVIWMCHASRGFAILHCWPCSIAESQKREFP